MKKENMNITEKALCMSFSRISLEEWYSFFSKGVPHREWGVCLNDDEMWVLPSGGEIRRKKGSQVQFFLTGHSLYLKPYSTFSQ